MEQLVARLAHNQEVAGSSPVPATKKSLCPPNFKVGINFFAWFIIVLLKPCFYPMQPG